MPFFVFHIKENNKMKIYRNRAEACINPVPYFIKKEVILHTFLENRNRNNIFNCISDKMVPHFRLHHGIKNKKRTRCLAIMKKYISPECVYRIIILQTSSLRGIKITVLLYKDTDGKHYDSRHYLFNQWPKDKIIISLFRHHIRPVGIYHFIIKKGDRYGYIR